MKILALLLLLATPLEAQFFDRDRCVTCTDKFEHLTGGAAVDFGLQAVRPWFAKSTAQRVAVVALAGAVFELGQWDASRGTQNAGRPGYGFGVLDLLADVSGALASEGLTALYRRFK